MAEHPTANDIRVAYNALLMKLPASAPAHHEIDYELFRRALASLGVPPELENPFVQGALNALRDYYYTRPLHPRPYEPPIPPKLLEDEENPDLGPDG
jgi:hypothetical protein